MSIAQSAVYWVWQSRDASGGLQTSRARGTGAPPCSGWLPSHRLRERRPSINCMCMPRASKSCVTSLVGDALSRSTCQCMPQTGSGGRELPGECVIPVGSS